VVLLVLGTACSWLVVVLLNPWALNIGGRSTPLLYWHGIGTLATKDGTTYPLYVFVTPGKGASKLQKNGLRPVSGLGSTAEICTSAGTSQVLKLTGTMWGSRSNTDGDLVSLRVFEWKVIDPQNKKGYFDLIGAWHGSTLVLDQPDAETRAFTTGLRIDGPKVTLHWADRADFDAACRAMESAAK
jgi:hypothetical protein